MSDLSHDDLGLAEYPAPTSVSTLAPQVHWYAVHTKPRQEQRALINLQQQGFECFLPTLSVEKLRKGKLVANPEPLFSRYLFIQLDSSQSGKSWSPIRSTLGVNRLVSFGAEPAKISVELIHTLRVCNAAQQSHTQALFEPGQQVQITQGPFANLSAIYEMSDGESRAMVLITILSQQCRLTVPPAHLRKVV